MNESFQKFLALYQLLKQMNAINAVDVDENGMLSVIEVRGFSKSSSAKVSFMDSTMVDLDHRTYALHVETRYNQSDFISIDATSTHMDLLCEISDIAFSWYLKSVSKEYPIPDEWKALWIEQGKIKEKVVTTYEIA